ncbi:protein kinase C delta type-like [Spea bombifrons]|uniref:protein kinase C delta type-like n=1 Tax=Spea bombifrons TaxID=233779 RepID=UPI00234AB1C5|nr:protein kinase C delta type-like [Spea bombifrons]
MEEKSEVSAVGDCCLLSGLRWSLKRCCPKKLRRFCKRVRKAFRSAVRRPRRRADSTEHPASRVVLKRKRESSSSEEERCRGRKRRRVTANDRDDGSQDLGQQGEQKRPEHRKQRMLMKGKVPIKRRRSQQESIVPAKRFRSLLPVSESGFTFHSVLGQGAFGKAALASVPARDSPVAVKLISTNTMRPESITKERRRVTANDRDDGSQDLGQQGEQKGPEHLKQCMLMKGKVPIKRRRSQQESIVPAKRFRSLLPMSIFHFTFHSVLGKGAFGKVVLASVPARDSPVAVKVISKNAMRPENIMKERRTLEVARNSPFLCHGYAAFQTQTCAVLVMEYMAGGSFEFYLKIYRSFTQSAAAFYSAEIVCGVQFLHSRGIIHRDLKADNVLFDAEGHAKICDFGIVAENVFGTAEVTEPCGTFMYMAPEVHLKKAYGAAVDWWSFGVLLNRMLTEAYPFFAGKCREARFRDIVHGSPRLSKNLSRKGRDILKQLLEKDPERRLGLKGDIRRHPFFRKIKWDDIESRRATPPYRPTVRLDLHRNKRCTYPSVLRIPENLSSSSDRKELSGFSSSSDRKELSGFSSSSDRKELSGFTFRFTFRLPPGSETQDWKSLKSQKAALIGPPP